MVTPPTHVRRLGDRGRRARSTSLPGLALTGAEHIAGAISPPHREISPDTTAALSKNKLYVAYCWGPGCNGSTRAALGLSALGFHVKELMGGIEYWKREGYPTEGDAITRGR